jgi:predicted methyltransferase
MRSYSLGFASLFGVLVSCAPAEAPPPLTPPPPASPPVAVVAPPPPAPPPPAPAALSPAEQKQADERKKLEQDFAKFDEQNRAERLRLTPELHAAAQTLVSKAYPSPRAQLAAILASPHRKPANAARDPQRHPQETLELFGIKPGQSVLEYGPGEGWYTEILAPFLAKSGKLYVTETDPNGPKTERSTLGGLATQSFLEGLPEAYGKVEPVVIDSKAPKLELDGKLDAVLLMRGAHGLYNNKQLGLWLAEFHRALKPHGVLGVEQHRAAPAQDPDESSKHGYLPEAFLIHQIEAAGFKLAGRSEISANPKDTKDYAEGVWSLPPTLREGEKNREKYLAIGESDRMTLKFVKVEASAGAKLDKQSGKPSP